MTYVTRLATPSQLNRSSKTPRPNGRVCGIRKLGPYVSSLSKARSAKALSLLRSDRYQSFTSSLNHTEYAFCTLGNYSTHAIFWHPGGGSVDMQPTFAAVETVQSG